MKKWLGFLFILLYLSACELTNLEETQTMSGIFFEQEVIEEITNLQNEAIKDFVIELGESDLGLIIHNIEPEKLVNLNLTQYVVEPVEESFLFIPQYLGSDIKVYEVEWNDNSLVEENVLFEVKNLQNNDGFYLQCPVPEGIPMMKVVISYQNRRVEYIIAYDGSGMRPDIEVLVGQQD